MTKAEMEVAGVKVVMKVKNRQELTFGISMAMSATDLGGEEATTTTLETFGGGKTLEGSKDGDGGEFDGDVSEGEGDFNGENDDDDDEEDGDGFDFIVFRNGTDIVIEGFHQRHRPEEKNRLKHRPEQRTKTQTSTRTKLRFD